MAQSTAIAKRPDQRLGQTYRFADPDMDLFFVAALGWGPTSGLDIGQAFYIASQITDGDADSWVRAFSDYGEAMNAQADSWNARGRKRAAGEARLKAFASYRSAWQFAGPGDLFKSLVVTQDCFRRGPKGACGPRISFPGAFPRQATARSLFPERESGRSRGARDRRC